MTSDAPPIRKTCKRYDVPGHAHYLTFSCFGRKPFLKGDRACRWLADAIQQARSRTGFDLWAYVFMPDHVHLLVFPHSQTGISGVLKEIKQPVAVEALRFVSRHAPAFLQQMADLQPNGRCSHRFWQRGGGYDRNIWTADQVHEKITYIHANPVRRGLVSRPGQWAWSSWRAWERDVDKPLKIDRHSLPSLAR